MTSAKRMSKAKREALGIIAHWLKERHGSLAYALRDKRRILIATGNEIAVLKRQRAELDRMVLAIEAGLKVNLEIR